MPADQFIPAIFLLAKNNRYRHAVFTNTRHKVIHVRIQLHLERMVWEIVYLRKGNIMDFRELGFVPAFLGGKEVI